MKPKIETVVSSQKLTGLHLQVTGDLLPEWETRKAQS